ncbi:MAG: hypothetical protein AAGA30_19815 [Planctomycetota bacterium]
MKFAACTFALLAILATGFDGTSRFSVLEPSQPSLTGPTLIDSGPVVVRQETVLEKPMVQSEIPHVQMDAAPAYQPLMSTTPQPSYFSPQTAIAHAHESCQITCCCKPRPRQRCVEVNVCLVDPLGCEHEACMEIPVCCLNETPCVEWNKRLLGRKVATLCWECCDHEVKVIITRSGKVKVRD